MSEQRTIHLIGGADDESANLCAESLNGRCRITFRYRERTLAAEAGDYFEAFCEIRRQLAREKLIPFCYGASLDVYPSGMCRDMGEGLMAYKLALGRAPGPTDLVHIFDEGPDVAPATVERQREFFEDWLKSIGR